MRPAAIRWSDSDPSYATEGNGKTTAVGKHVCSVFANHTLIYKTGDILISGVNSVQSHLKNVRTSQPSGAKVGYTD